MEETGWFIQWGEGGRRQPKMIPIRWGYEDDDDEERHGLVEGDVIVARDGCVSLQSWNRIATKDVSRVGHGAWNSSGRARESQGNDIWTMTHVEEISKFLRGIYVVVFLSPSPARLVGYSSAGIARSIFIYQIAHVLTFWCLGRESRDGYGYFGHISGSRSVIRVHLNNTIGRSPAV